MAARLSWRRLRLSAVIATAARGHNWLLHVQSWPVVSVIAGARIRAAARIIFVSLRCGARWRLRISGSRLLAVIPVKCSAPVRLRVCTWRRSESVPTWARGLDGLTLLGRRSIKSALALIGSLGLPGHLLSIAWSGRAVTAASPLHRGVWPLVAAEKMLVADRAAGDGSRIYLAVHRIKAVA